MDKEKFYSTVYKLIEDHFTSFRKKPSYLMVNPKCDLGTFMDQDDLKQYQNNKFKGMLIVRDSDLSMDKLVVY